MQAVLRHDRALLVGREQAAHSLNLCVCPLNSTPAACLPLPVAHQQSICISVKAQPRRRQWHASHAAVKTPYPTQEMVQQLVTEAPTDVLYDAVIIGSGMGGLSAASQLVAKGAKVLVLEKYLIPGGSAGRFVREGYTFDVGSSMMFGFSDGDGNTNLITKCLAAVGKKLKSVADPTQVHYHLPPSTAHPQGLEVQTWREYEDFVSELSARFPHEAAGIRGFYGECWNVFNALNALELKSLEEPRYLLTQFSKQPIACLTLAAYSTTNAGDVARKYVKDPELLQFIDLECFLWSTVLADMTPMINAGMVFCDRHFNGINYPVGGVGMMADALVEGITERGSHVIYKANVKEILTEGEGEHGRAVGVRMADGRVFRGKTVISNATRWDTFEHMLGEERITQDEKLFRERYKKAPSFFQLHLGVKDCVFQDQAGKLKDLDCHHIILEDWSKMQDSHGTLFISIPSLLDPSVAPAGHQIVHVFTPDWIDAWQNLSLEEYAAKKEVMATAIIQRLEALLPGLGANLQLKEVGTPRTNRRFLNREDGTYGPIPTRRPLGILSMPLNTTSIPGLYCVGDSTFPGQGVNAVVFSGFGCAHRVACDLDMEPTWPVLDKGFNMFLRYIRDRS